MQRAPLITFARTRTPSPLRPAVLGRHNWTLDLVLEEDDRQPCLHSRAALEVTAWLRVLAYNLISSWRAALPLKDKLPVAWARACEVLRDALVHGRAATRTARPPG